MDHSSEIKITRRELLIAGAVSATAAAVPLASAQPNAQPRAASGAGAAPAIAKVTLRINGKPHTLHLDTRTTLLDALREHLHLTGTKKGCDHGQCGACTVMVDGRRINACLTLALMHEGAQVTTIEGVGKQDALHPMQAAFIKHDGFQCGYCTPGQLMSGVACLKEGHAKTDGEIREWMSGNLCRCGAYPNIVAAIRQVEQSGFKG